MNTTRGITISLVLAITALAPATALARNGADDDPALGDDRGGQQVGTTSTDDNPSAADDNGGTRTSSRSRSDRRAAGTCTAGSTAKLKTKLRNGRLETEFEVDQNRAGVRWDVRLSRNGNLAVATARTTRAPSGSFSLERRLRNGAGRDRISATATSPSGEVCSASLTI
ncbi:MAG: hypothetical protein QOE31_2676 [Solirubrobacteraceae bacterium]|jgi:hypothetical protein|nr:hypothetical protein [Solirubrobacteraceae bacterium]